MPTSTRPDGPLGPMTDEQLSRLATGGDQDAFLELFTRHEHGLLNFCHRLTGSREDAADLVQESFLRVFARLPALEGREVNLAAYLRRTARNLAYDASAGRGAEVMVDDLEVVAGADDALETDPERAMLLGDQQAAVQRANAALPERHRLALALRELEDMDYAQIGEVLEVIPEAVGQILVRARLGLRRQLRLASVDEDRMAPACRARLGDIGALIDGQLDHDRAYVLRQHLATCATCAQVRTAFEDSRIRYRAWLPIPLIAGLGLSALHSARDRGLLGDFTDAISWGDDGGAAGGQLGGAGERLGGPAGQVGGSAGGGTRAIAGAGGSAGAAGLATDTLWGSWSRRRKTISLVGGAIALLAVGGGSALLAIRGDAPPAGGVTLAAGDVTGDVAQVIPPAAAQELPKPPLPGAPPPAPAPGATDPGDPAAAPAVSPPPGTDPDEPAAARRRGPGVTTASPPSGPQVTAAAAPGAPPPAAPPAPGTTTSSPPPVVTTVRQPPPVVTTVREPPPVTTQRQPPADPPKEDPPPRDDPPPTTTGRTPNDPPPVTTIRVPTIRIPVVPPVTTIRIPTIRIPPPDPPVVR